MKMKKMRLLVNGVSTVGLFGHSNRYSVVWGALIMTKYVVRNFDFSDLNSERV